MNQILVYRPLDFEKKFIKIFFGGCPPTRDAKRTDDPKIIKPVYVIYFYEINTLEWLEQSRMLYRVL